MRQSERQSQRHPWFLFCILSGLLVVASASSVASGQAAPQDGQGARGNNNSASSGPSAAAATMAAEPTPGGWPPPNFRLDTLSLRVQRQFGHGQPAQLLQLPAQGQALLDAGRPPSSLPVTLSDSERLGLVNGLYSLRFFDLPSSLGAPPSLYLKPDGTVGLQRTALVDAGSVRVCFSLPGYEKCVQYSGGPAPQALDDWVKATLGLAASRTKPAS